MVGIFKIFGTVSDNYRSGARDVMGETWARTKKPHQTKLNSERFIAI